MNVATFKIWQQIPNKNPAMMKQNNGIDHLSPSSSLSRTGHMLTIARQNLHANTRHSGITPRKRQQFSELKAESIVWRSAILFYISRKCAFNKSFGTKI